MGGNGAQINLFLLAVLHLLPLAANKRLLSVFVALIEAPHEFTGPRVYLLSRESQKSNGGKKVLVQNLYCFRWHLGDRVSLDGGIVEHEHAVKGR